MKRQKRSTPTVFDYKDVKTLQRFVNVYGQIEPIKDKFKDYINKK